MSEFIIPPHQIKQPDNPVVFLAGPVQGAHDWQRAAANHLIDAGAEASIISPRGLPELYKEPSPWLNNELQTPWEKHHLRLARDKGVLAMWMAEQVYETPGRAYAQTSRIELGRIAGWLDYNSPNIKLVFGISPEYIGGNQTYMEQVCNEFNIPVQRRLDEWCAEILRKLG